MLSLVNGFSNSVVNDFDKMRENLDYVLNSLYKDFDIRTSSNHFPPINVKENDSEIIVNSYIAGFKVNDFDIILQSNVLTITIERKQNEDLSEKIENKGYKFSRNERFSGHFRRIIYLPDNIDHDKVKANYENGVLEIIINKKEEYKPRKINVNIQ